MSNSYAGYCVIPPTVGSSEGSVDSVQRCFETLMGEPTHGPAAETDTGRAVESGRRAVVQRRPASRQLATPALSRRRAAAPEQARLPGACFTNSSCEGCITGSTPWPTSHASEDRSVAVRPRSGLSGQPLDECSKPAMPSDLYRSRQKRQSACAQILFAQSRLIKL